MTFDPARYPERRCETHGTIMLVGPNGFVGGRQQYRQFCLECRKAHIPQKRQPLPSMAKPKVKALPRVRTSQEEKKLKKRASWKKLKPKWRKLNRDKHAAHQAVSGAIARGRLQKQPCERCGTTVAVEAHHEDYSKRLEVNWLCRRHHLQLHAERSQVNEQSEAA